MCLCDRLFTVLLHKAITKGTVRCTIQLILNLFYEFSIAINMLLTEVISETKDKNFG